MSKTGQNLLFEMLRSFVALADTLNLTKAAFVTGSSKPTIRRHIRSIEEARGGKLFTIRGRRYELTAEAYEALRSAKDLLSQGEAWFQGELRSNEGLDLINKKGADGSQYTIKQHRLDKLWDSGTELLQKGFMCWAKSQNRLDSRHMKPIRSYILVYRPYFGKWQCVEIGEKSSFAQWFGNTWAKSNVGHYAGNTPAASDFDDFTLSHYGDILQNGGVRYDHIFRRAKSEFGGPLKPVKFMRLLCGCRFPDGKPAVVVLTELTDSIDIEL